MTDQPGWNPRPDTGDRAVGHARSAAPRRQPSVSGIRCGTRLLLALLLAGSAATLQGQALTISQIDTAPLLTRQSVRLFVSLTDAAAAPVRDAQAARFTVFESADGVDYTAASNLLVVPARQTSTGVQFLLLIDNSGSMYDTVSGAATDSRAAMRITAAIGAVEAFLDGITDPRDQVGLATFNTTYTWHVGPGTAAAVRTALPGIARPSRELAYTELYAALREALAAAAELPGRRVVIVLSDGENFPYFTHAGAPNPQFGEELVPASTAVELGQREGISVFAINFGAARDPALQQIAADTGGAVFDAADPEQLRDVYQRIRDRVAAEYVLTYRASMAPADRRWVQVRYQDQDGAQAAVHATRFYYASTVLGLPLDRLGLSLLLALLLPLLLWLVLTRLRFERLASAAGLQVLSSRGRPSATRISLGGGATVIGSSAAADLTVAGSPAVAEQHATIAYDQTAQRHTVAASGEAAVSVNNQPVTSSRTLHPGDVLNVGGTIIVFEDDERPDPASDA